MIKFNLLFTNQFKKDYKKAIKRNLEIEKIHIAFQTLEKTGTLPSKYKTHLLKGNYHFHYEAHINPDWLIIWHKQGNDITLVRTGSHSDIF